MIEKYLKFLDFALPRLCKRYPQGESLGTMVDYFNDDPKFEISYEEKEHIKELYEYEYFIIHGNLDNAVITPEWKSIIELHGSLSAFREYENEILEEENNKQKDIEDLNKRVGVLTIENLELQNRKMKREVVIGIITFTLGAIATNWKDILVMLQIIDKP